MKEKEDKLVLKQIIGFIEKIEDYLKGVDHDQFLKDGRTQDSVIRNIEIVGEACNRLSENFLVNNPEFPILEATSMRNRLIHGYDDIDLEIVWNTATQDIQTLKHIIIQILN